MTRTRSRAGFLSFKKATAPMTFEPKGAYFVEDFELGPLGFAGWTAVILFFFAGLVHFFYFLGQAEYAVFDGVECGV